MALTGMSETEYREFVAQCVEASDIRPGTPVALTGFELFLVNLAVGALLTAASALLAPKPKQEERPEVEDSTVEGQDVVRRDRFTAKSGFDSVQNVVDIGSIVPIVYAKRGSAYGGVRINTNLLWSQMQSIGGGQFFKGLFLIGEGSQYMKLDINQTALGNNTLASYELKEGAEAGRITVYEQPKGGRVKINDYVGGVIPDNDLGAKDVSGDIYSIQGDPDFCEVVLPSNQTEFGVYSIIGNNLGYKIGEDWGTLSQWQQRPDDTFERQQSNEAIANRVKNSVTWTTRAGFVKEGGETLDVELTEVKKDRLLTYKIYRSSQDVVFRESGATSGGEPASEIENIDARTAIASKQKVFDEAINVGDVYKIGSATGICVKRSELPFISSVEFDGDGQSVEATFQILEEGKVHLWPEEILATEKDDYEAKNSPPKGLREDGVTGVIASSYSHCFRLSVAAFSVERPCYIVEVGLRSNLQLKTSGISNFNSLVAREAKNGNRVPDTSYQAYVDAEYCGGMSDGEDTDSDTYRKEIKAGRYSAADTRYSFFRILIREINSQEFVPLKNLYGVRSATGVDIYSYIRFNFGSNARREFRFVPVTSWEIRSEEAAGDLYVLDPHVEGAFSVREANVEVQGNGLKIEREQSSFQVKAFLSPDGQIGMAVMDDIDNENYVDGWARLAEAFIYDEVSCSAEQGPEHSISYVNLITSNEEKPKYDKLAMLGLNVTSTREIRNLNQLSVYVTQGVIDSSLFPDVFKDLLQSERYGVGGILSDKQIDVKSFNEAAKWSQSLGHAFDGAVSSRVNLRSWGAQRAQDFLLDLSVSGGRFQLKPALKFWEAEPVAALFTSGNIIDETFALSYLPIQDRTDPIVSVKWREERYQGGVDQRGLFPVIREFSVRYKGVPDTAPVVQLDLSNFCTSPRQAADRAYYECLLRRYVTHAVTFKTTPQEATIQAGSIIRVGMETLTYEQPLNGAITEEGLVTSWPELENGRHSILVWDGNSLQEAKLKVQNGKTKQFLGCVFCLQKKKQETESYKVQSVSFDNDGNVEIEAINWCVDKDGVSCLTRDFKDSNFELDGINIDSNKPPTPGTLPPFIGPPKPPPTPIPLPPAPSPEPTPGPDPTPCACTLVYPPLREFPTPTTPLSTEGTESTFDFSRNFESGKERRVRIEYTFNYFMDGDYEYCFSSGTIDGDDPETETYFWEASLVEKYTLRVRACNNEYPCCAGPAYGGQDFNIPWMNIGSTTPVNNVMTPGSTPTITEPVVTWGCSQNISFMAYKYLTGIRVEEGNLGDDNYQVYIFLQPVAPGGNADNYVPRPGDPPPCPAPLPLIPNWPDPYPDYVCPK